MVKSFILLLLFASTCLQAQESLLPLQTNPAVAHGRKMKNDPVPALRQVLNLPFLDDFSLPGPFPDPQRWINQDVYLNNDMAKFPPSLGVATFDALDDTGALYPEASSFPFIADYLTSQFINLSPYQASDSLYFSFFYQPAGRGNTPEKQDSLVLQFLVQYRADTLIDTTAMPPDTSFFDRWQSVWHAEGMNVDTFYAHGNRWFRQVMIPLTDPVFFRNDFQFRFYNYASLGSTNIPSWRSNADFWHLDYIYLNSTRGLADSLYPDFTFVNQAPNFLKRYTAMPMRQYLANPNSETRDTIEMLISNLGNAGQFYEYKFSVKDQDGTIVLDTTYGFYNLDPFYLSGYQTWPAHRYPKFPDFVFPGQGNDSSQFTITHMLFRSGAPQEFIIQNDTLRSTQRFFNYLAYDDGTAEAGYGLSPAGSMLAVKYQLNTPDTLRGVQMFFNRTINNSSQRNFKLVVWADANGKPGEVLYTGKRYVTPEYEGGLNQFYTYLLDSETPLVLGNDKLTFYVGWVQQSDNNLNVGFDSTTNNSDKIFYNIDGTWTNTSFSGSLMIRPCLGPSLEPPKTVPINNLSSRLVIFPNPSAGTFTIALPPAYAGYDKPADYQLSVFNLLGEKILHLPYLSTYNLSFLPRGVYLLQLSTTDNYLNYQGKVVITK